MKPTLVLPSLLLLAVQPVQAAPQVSMDVGYAPFELEQHIDDSQNRGGRVLALGSAVYEADTAARLRAELAWPYRSHLALVAALQASYADAASASIDHRDFATGATATVALPPLDELYLLGLHGGLRWTSALQPRVHLQADLGASYNYWHSRFQTLDIVMSSSTSLTRFVQREQTDSDRYAALYAGLGLSFALSSSLAVTADVQLQQGEEFSTRQLNTGLRFTF